MMVMTKDRQATVAAAAASQSQESLKAKNTLVTPHYKYHD